MKSFAETSKDVWLENSHILHAQCQNKKGEWVPSRIDLDDYIGNEYGKPVFPGYKYCCNLGVRQEAEARSSVLLLCALAA